MNDEPSFLRAIRESPGDDNPRLSYTNWSEERGDAWSRFLRLQFEMRRFLGKEPAFEAIKAQLTKTRRHLDTEWLVWVDDDLAIPAGLSAAGHRAAEAILEFLAQERNCDTGGCKAFYSPGEWRNRGEKFGLDAPLIVVHDGGDLATYFSLDQGEIAMFDRQVAFLRKHGFYAEQSTSWYSAICPSGT